MLGSAELVEEISAGADKIVKVRKGSLNKILKIISSRSPVLHIQVIQFQSYYVVQINWYLKKQIDQFMMLFVLFDVLLKNGL
jgi:hypothetical protein